MNVTIKNAIEVLTRTPDVLNAMLQNLSIDWVLKNEGGETWCAYDILGHLIEGEKTNWIPRVEVILSDKSDKSFIPFNRFAQFEVGEKKSLEQLLEEFQVLRKNNVGCLGSKNITNKDLEKKGIHPSFGEVTLSQLLSTWVVHDLNHIAQINRVMAFQYKEEVGPWKEYLRILK